MSNYEALLVLQEEDGRRQELEKQLKLHHYTKYPENVNTLTYETLQYLQKSPCSSQTAQQIAAFKEAIAEYGLTKAETLQLINLRPKSPVEAYLIIEQCDDRLTRDDLEAIVNIISETLPREDDDDGDEEEEEVGGDNVEMADGAAIDGQQMDTTK